jgi:hypothetical protein
LHLVNRAAAHDLTSIGRLLIIPSHLLTSLPLDRISCSAPSRDVGNAQGGIAPLPEPAHPARRDYIKQQVREDKSVLRHEASAEAMGLLCEVDALTLGLELAEDLKCKTRAEKMLAHQAAAFHVASFKFLQRAGAERDRASSVTSRGGISQAACVESARMLNAAARASSAFAGAVATIKS